MRNLNKISIIGVLLSAVFYLGSCGGGGGGSSVAAANVLTGTFTTSNLVGAAAHIHDGDVGVAGPVVIPLAQSTPGTWTVPANTILTDTQIARLRAGGYYVNVHTALNPGGEIRGQLGPASTTGTAFTASLTLAQEVPTPTLPAGAAY